MPPTGLIPWFSKTEGNTYATLLHHPFLFKEIQRSAQEVARIISGAIAGEVRAGQDLISDNAPFLAPLSQHTKYPSLSLSPALHYLPFASRFPLPHFTLAVLFAFSLPILPLFLYCLFCPFLVCSYGWNSCLFITK